MWVVPMPEIGVLDRGGSRRRPVEIDGHRQGLAFVRESKMRFIGLDDIRLLSA
jgi:hypothetical protein